MKAGWHRELKTVKNKGPETRKGLRTPLAKQYAMPEIWYVKCIIAGGWVPAAGCNKDCCTDHISKRTEGDELIVECQAA